MKYPELKKLGLCSSCRKPNNNYPHVRCKKCKEFVDCQQHTRLKSLAVKGLCLCCKQNESRQGKTTCEQCGIKNAEKQSELREDRRRNRLCTRCRQPSRQGGVFCNSCIEKQQAQNDNYRHNLKIAVFNYYGSKCKCCGEGNPLFLQLDHINNDGCHHRRKLKGKPIYAWLKKNGFPEGFQLLCANCNYGKRMNNGVCPHLVMDKDEFQLSVV